MELEAELFAFLRRKYVQRADARQKAMGLVYTEAETHDLAREIARFISNHDVPLDPTALQYAIGDLGVARRHLARLRSDFDPKSLLPMVLTEISESVERCVKRLENLKSAPP
jgi:hypothetical protein